MPINTISPLTSLTLAAGIQTAYTAPSGTAVLVKYISVSPNTALSAGSAASLSIRIGPTANITACVMWQNVTALSPSSFIREKDLVISFSGAGAAIVMSADSANRLDVYIAGLRITP